MKTEETTWSNDDDVWATFSSLGVFNSSKSSKEVKTPKHRISNSQLKMVNSHRERSSLPAQNSHAVSFGRGKFLTNIKDQVPSRFPPCRTEKDIKEKDAAISQDIRAATDLNFTNCDIEKYIYSGCVADSDEVSSTAGKNKEEKSDDQISVSSDLRVDAADFYPPGVNQIDPDKLAESLEKLTKEKQPCDSSLLPSSPKFDKYLIGFNTKETSSESEVINEPVGSSTKKKSYLDSITISSTSPSPSVQTLFTYEKFKPFVEKNPKPDQMKKPTDQPESKKPETRGKRVLKNALLLGLKNRIPEEVNEPNHLMKPSDFELSSNPSEFVPIKRDDPDEIDSPQPYDFFSDPTVDMETKSLVNSLMSDDLSSDSIRSSSSISSERSRKSKKSYSSFRPYNYQYSEEDFPALS